MKFEQLHLANLWMYLNSIRRQFSPNCSSVDPFQMPRSVASDRGLHFLLSPVPVLRVNMEMYQTVPYH